MIFEAKERFRLTDKFLDRFKGKQPQWGPLGYITYKRTYARIIEERTEEFWETLKRVVEGCYTVQLNHCRRLKLPWQPHKAQRSAQIMYELMWNFKFLPPGRGLWMLGTDYIYERGGAALNSCAFVSTESIKFNFSEPFTFLMDMSMLGVGVAFDTRGAGTVIIDQPKKDESTYIIADSKEGWVNATEILLNSYVGKGAAPRYDYSQIRPEGDPIKTFGGIAPGPQPLRDCLANIRTVMNRYIGCEVDSILIVDLMNILGKCVVSGGVRRTAELALGESDDEEYANLKDPDLYKKELLSWRWASNNSILSNLGEDYTRHAAQTAKNGEPGYVWIENCREYGRMIDGPSHADPYVMGVNPCGEQSLESFELCVNGNTQIQLENGLDKIENLLGQKVKIWNGEKWSAVSPRQTGKSRKLYRVILSDGTFIDVTGNHRWLVKGKTKRVFREVETLDLQEKDQLPDFELGEIIGEQEDQAFEYGAFSGDGYVDNNITMLCFCEDPKKLDILKYKGKKYKPQNLSNYTWPVQRIRLDLDFNICKQLRDKKAGIPKEIFSWNKESILEYIAGWIETDGNVQKNPNSENYRIYGTEQKMRDLVLLIRRVGIPASVRLMAKKGHKTNYGIRNQDIYYCTIASYYCGIIPTRVKKVTKIASGFTKNNAYKKSKSISNLPKQKIIGVYELPGRHPTYCFDEPEKHMGVFANAISAQCNLVESFPSRHENYEEYEKTLKYAYLYAKTVTLIPTHNERTNEIMLRNRRIGLSQSGIVESFQRHGRRTHFNWCNTGYDFISELDEKYSRFFCVPKSIKKTTVKPSGTISLLPGVTPGIHYPHSEYYYRTIRIDKTSLLLPKLETAGYKIEESKTDNAMVVYFPVKEKNFHKGKSEVSIWEQVENACQMQHYWADNQVSITVTFNKDEAKDIARILELYETKMKVLSFLPLTDHKYEQAPYQEISEKEYNTAREKLKKVNLRGVQTDEITERFCDGDSCDVHSS